MRWISLGFVAVVPLSCGVLSSELTCTLNAVFGLRVNVVDSITGAPRAREAIAYARSGTYLDSAVGLPLSPSGVEFTALYLVKERAGVYDVTVQRDGYARWTQSGVRVRGDACHVRTTEVTARLRPL